MDHGRACGEAVCASEAGSSSAPAPRRLGVLCGVRVSARGCAPLPPRGLKSLRAGGECVFKCSFVLPISGKLTLAILSLV